ncbi:DUF3540 domain-containing protein [Enterobacteriaceae bacterium 4M9]|nr:DUF3540 domain-containing protein [Enterobacteriaceae bacterium 4M9]
MNTAHASHALPVHLPQQSSGQVVDISPNGNVVVESNGLGWTCRRAASCLLTPELGDTVLIVQSDNDTLWLLAVLERASPENLSHIGVNGSLCISTIGGSLTLESERQLALSGQDLQMTAERGRCAIDTLEFEGEEVSARVGIGRWVGNRCESVWQTVTQLSQTLFRQVKQTEHVRAGQLDYQAEDYLRLHARNTLISAKDITRIDSEQIHVG